MTPSILDVLLLFEDSDNFIIEKLGIVNLILKTVQLNKLVETSIPLQLDPCGSKAKEVEDVPSSETSREIKNLKMSVSSLEKKMQKMEEKLNFP